MEAFLLPTDFVVVTSVVKIAVLFSLRFEKKNFLVLLLDSQQVYLAVLTCTAHNDDDDDDDASKYTLILWLIDLNVTAAYVCWNILSEHNL